MPCRRPWRTPLWVVDPPGLPGRDHWLCKTRINIHNQHNLSNVTIAISELNVCYSYKEVQTTEYILCAIKGNFIRNLSGFFAIRRLISLYLIHMHIYTTCMYLPNCHSENCVYFFAWLNDADYPYKTSIKRHYLYWLKGVW